MSALPICNALRATRRAQFFASARDDDDPAPAILINPDGPKAADIIEALVDALQNVRDLLSGSSFEGYFDDDIVKLDAVLAKARGAQ